MFRGVQSVLNSTLMCKGYRFLSCSLCLMVNLWYLGWSRSPVPWTVDWAYSSQCTSSLRSYAALAPSLKNNDCGLVVGLKLRKQPESESEQERLTLSRESSSVRTVATQSHFTKFPWKFLSCTAAAEHPTSPRERERERERYRERERERERRRKTPDFWMLLASICSLHPTKTDILYTWKHP